MSLLVGHLICALLTWVALVSEGLRGLTPENFVRAIRSDIRTFGPLRILLWFLLCLFAWPLVWSAWLMEWLDSG